VIVLPQYSNLDSPLSPKIAWKRIDKTALDPEVLNEYKDWIHRPREDTTWDTETSRLIGVAQKAIETHCQFTVVPSTWQGTLSAMPDVLRIFRRPFRAVTAVSYVDPDGNIQSIADTNWQSAPDRQMCGLLIKGDDYTWPQTAKRIDAFRITVTTGFYNDADEAELPGEVKQALMMATAELDMNRGDAGGSPGSNTTVYAMKQTRAAFLNPDIAALLSHLNYQDFTIV
jgi:uncharacterized phiE125 gp8 family phage protein